MNSTLLVSSVIMIFGAILISVVEKMTFMDALWWSFVTATTVGYGDISPSTGVGRIMACILMLVGIGLIGILTGTISSYFMSIVNKKEIVEVDSYKTQIIKNIQKQIVSIDELTEQDIDDLCKVLKALRVEKIH